jgi:hypothetical protein
MALPRLHLFEFNDSPWAPAPIREALIEALSLALDWGRMLRGMAGPFGEFLGSTQATEVLDLCAGAGSPAVVLARELRLAGKRPPRFLLTDLMPHADVWARLKAQDPEAIAFIADSVDATQIPAGLGAGKARMIINALHHLPPAVAGAVLRGACEGGPGVFVVEGFERSPLRFLPYAPMGALSMIANVWRSPRNRLAKALLLPLTLALAPWDGFVSTMRVYTEAELRAMVAPLAGEFDLRYGTWSFPLGGKGYWFSAVRRRQV